MSRALALLAVLGTACATPSETAAGPHGARGDSPDAVTADADQARLLVEENLRGCEIIGQRPVSIDEELHVGDVLAFVLASRSNGVYGPKTMLTAYLNRLGKGLALRSQRPSADWTFAVLESPKAFAASAPGGYVLVTTAMLARCENEAQLAGVLAHEIGHVVAGHALGMWAKEKVAMCRAEVLTGGANLQTARGDDALGASLEEIVFDRFADKLFGGGFTVAQEHEADAIGAELVLFAGYDAREYVKLLRALPDEAGQVGARAAVLQKRIAVEFADLDLDGFQVPPRAGELDALPDAGGRPVEALPQK